jgi:hypothetical protein
MTSVPRIAVYGIGRYGSAAARRDHGKGWPVVAAYNRAGSKVGQDVGRAAGLDTDVGVVIQDCDAADYSALDADIAIVATSDRLTHNIEGLRTTAGSRVPLRSGRWPMGAKRGAKGRTRARRLPDGKARSGQHSRTPAEVPVRMEVQDAQGVGGSIPSWPCR